MLADCSISSTPIQGDLNQNDDVALNLSDGPNKEIVEKVVHCVVFRDSFSRPVCISHGTLRITALTLTESVTITSNRPAESSCVCVWDVHAV